MAGKSAVLTVKILTDAKGSTKGLDQASSKFDKFGGAVGKAAVPAAAGLAALGVAAVSAAKAAGEDAKAQALLAQALKNSTGATDAGVAAAEAWISKTSASAAVADDELRPALATLARATGDVGKAQDALALALDISAATGKDLKSVSAALAKGYAGNTAALGRLVPGLDKGVVATKDMEKITAELARTTGGSAAKAANSAAGQVKNMTIQFGEAQEALGAALLPALTEGVKLLTQFATWTQNNTTLVLVIAGVLGGFAAAIIVLNAALKAYAVVQTLVELNTKRAAAGQWALNAAMLANPVGLVVVAVIALIAGIVLLWKKNEGFRRFVIGMWKAIASAASAAWRAIKASAAAVMSWLRSAGSSIASFFRSVWSSIRNAAASAWNGIRAVVSAVLSAIRHQLNTFKTAAIAVWKAVSSAARTAWNGLRSLAGSVFNAMLRPINAVRSAIDAVIGAVQRLIGWLGRIKVPKISLPKIPGLSSVSSSLSSPTLRRGGDVGAMAAGATVININVSGTLNDADAARALRRVLAEDSRRRRGIRIGPGAVA